MGGCIMAAGMCRFIRYRGSKMILEDILPFVPQGYTWLIRSIDESERKENERLIEPYFASIIHATASHVIGSPPIGRYYGQGDSPVNALLDALSQLNAAN